MRTVAKQIVWPARGVERISAHHDAAPDEARAFAAPFALNVRGTCGIERRRRGGSRPGLADVPQGASVTPLHPARTVYRDRLFKADGANWAASRIGAHDDFAYGADKDDAAKAVYGGLAAAGSASAEPITAFMPLDDQRLYIATASSLWLLSGDPATGSISRVSTEVGVSGAAAWCWTGRRLFFLSREGLFGLAPGESPVLLSAALPALSGDAAALVGHDPHEDALHLFTASGDFFVELAGERPAFWPVSLAASPDALGVTDGGRFALRADGVWRTFDDAAPCEAPSSVALGPFRLSASDDKDAFLAELHLATALGSAAVTATAHFGRSAEEAEAAALGRAASPLAAATFEFIGGWNAVWRPRRRGAWCVLVLSSAGGWAFEAARAICRHTGRLRP